MNKIRIAFFADMLLEKFDGYSRTIQQLISKVPKDKFDFMFITGTKDHKASSQFKTLYVPSIPIPMNASYKMAIPQIVKLRMDKELRAYNPHIIHISNPSLLGKYASEYAQIHNVPTVSIYHTHYISYVKYYLRNFPSLIPVGERYMSNVNKAIYDRCNIVYVPAQDITESLKERGFATNHYKLWQRGIDTNMFSPEKRDLNHIRKITGNKNPNILFASRIVWEKNLATLIDIYNLYQGQQVNFVIAGDGVALKELKQKMPNAYFLGNLSHDELSTVYASSDIFLFPSDTESFGNVVLEAMASGLPVVSANSGGPVGILRDGKSGYLCDAHNAKAYQEKIDLLLQDEEHHALIQRQALERVEHFSWDRLIEIYCNDLALLSEVPQAVYA